jgi:hypothetical protein
VGAAWPKGDRMMLYMEYERLKRKYLESQRIYDSIISEKESLFQRTQPKSVNSENERVNGSHQNNPFDDYLIVKEQNKIDERLAEAKSLMAERYELLKQKEVDLRKSKTPENQIYAYRYIDRMKVRKISWLINYSEPQIYRILRTIRRKIEHDRK